MSGSAQLKCGSLQPALAVACAFLAQLLTPVLLVLALLVLALTHVSTRHSHWLSGVLLLAGAACVTSLCCCRCRSCTPRYRLQRP